MFSHLQSSQDLYDGHETRYSRLGNPTLCVQHCIRAKLLLAKIYARAVGFSQKGFGSDAVDILLPTLFVIRPSHCLFLALSALHLSLY